MKVNKIPTPALVLDMDAFEQNRKTLKQLLANTNVSFRPHYKTYKCTTIAHMQINDGAKGITCAKLGEAEDLVHAGINDVLIANQIVEPVKIARAAYLATCCKLTLCVDNIDNIRALERAAAAQDAIIHVYVEYNIGMNRCGVDTPEEFISLAEEVIKCPHLEFDGIQAYAGQLSHEEDYTERIKKSRELEEKRLIELLDALKKRNIHVKEVSGVSTGTVELHKEKSVYTEVQVGSYVFMDAAYKKLNIAFVNSLFVLSTVVSISEDVFVTDAGRKAISDDQASPIVLRYPDAPVLCSEEHSTILKKGIDTRDLKIGDKLLMIPGHCCTTINLHDYIYFVRKGEVIDRVPVTSRGKSY